MYIKEIFLNMAVLVHTIRDCARTGVNDLVLLLRRVGFVVVFYRVHHVRLRGQRRDVLC